MPQKKGNPSRLCRSPGETMELGERLGRSVPDGLVVHLHGELGSGKTTFARGVLKGCGVPGQVKSPTYALAETYQVAGRMYSHLDFYRCRSAVEWLDSGLAETLESSVACLVEWPDRARGLGTPDAAVLFRETDEEQHRLLEFRPASARGKRWLSALDG